MKKDSVTNLIPSANYLGSRSSLKT